MAVPGVTDCEQVAPQLMPAGLPLTVPELESMHIHKTGALIRAAVLLGIVNAFVRPVVFILTLPLTILTFGIFLFVINALIETARTMGLDVVG